MRTKAAPLIVMAGQKGDARLCTRTSAIRAFFTVNFREHVDARLYVGHDEKGQIGG